MFKIGFSQEDQWTLPETTAVVLLVCSVVLVLTIEIAADRIGLQRPHEFLFSSIWVSAALLGAALAHFTKVDKRQEQIAVLGLGAIVVALFMAVRKMGLDPPFQNRIALLSYGMAIASCVVFVFMIVRKKRSLTSTIKIAAPAWLVVCSILISNTAINATASMATYDNNLFLFEEGLGLRIAAMIHSVLEYGPSLVDVLLKYIYDLLPVMVALHYGFDRSRRLSFPILFVVSAIVGSLLYVCFPAAGPAYSIENYYRTIVAAPSSYLDVASSNVPRNCMPSLHATWAYFFLWNSAHFKAPLRWMFRVFGILTLVATFTAGGHWFIDLVVAVPFAAAIQAACVSNLRWTNPKRSLIVAGCFALAIAWLVLLQNQHFFDGIPLSLRWLLILLSVSIPVVLVHSFILPQQTTNLGRCERMSFDCPVS